MFYFRFLFNNNPNDTFIRAYRKRWDEVSPTIFDDLYSFIDEFAQSEEAEALNISAGMDQKLWKWDLENLSVPSVVNHFKNKLASRKNWLTGAIGKFPTGIIKGDVNGDYTIDDDDVVEMANAIIGNPSGKYIKAAANMNNDNVVNAADLVLLVKTISNTVPRQQ